MLQIHLRTIKKCGTILVIFAQVWLNINQYLCKIEHLRKIAKTAGYFLQRW